MKDTVASAEPGTGADAPLEPAVPDSAMWIPGSALNCYEGDAALRDWLLTHGLLTERIRASAGPRFRMQLLGERRVAGTHLREITMSCGESAWLYARTVVPAATLAAQPWLGRIGTVTLGEALAAHGGVQRSEFAFARLHDDAPVIRRALEVSGLPRQVLWVRRSVFTIGGNALELFEVFLPGIGRKGATP